MSQLYIVNEEFIMKSMHGSSNFALIGINFNSHNFENIRAVGNMNLLH